MSPLGSDVPAVVVAVLTYRRPGDLAAIVPALQEQIATIAGPAEVVVVDNDPDGSAAAFVQGLGDDRVRYEHEPEPGIAAARNRALRSSPDADVLVFIDDDERPSQHWLRELLDLYLRDRPAAVVGPVVSEFEAELSDWVVAGRFFDRLRHPTGTQVDVAATNNLLLDLSVVRSVDLWFDSRFGISGGSDTLFTRTLAAHGRLIWCDEAVVTDVVPAARCTQEWVLQRAHRSGNSWARTSMVLAGSGMAKTVARVRLWGSGGVRVAGGAAQWSLGRVLGDLGRRARGVRTIKRGTGMLSGSVGRIVSEYRRPTATPQADRTDRAAA